MADTLEKILKSASLAQKAKQNISAAIYPTNIVVNLNGPDGNVFAIIGICNEVAQSLKLDSNEILKFNTEVFAQKKYEDILDICQRWFGLIYIKN